MPLERKEFEYIRNFLQKRSAIVLDEEKQYLVESRLMPLARREGYAGISELVTKMQTSAVNGLHQKVVEAMTTHETSFYRDARPFDALRHAVLPELIKAQAATRKLRIWCAACSSGQEPYSVAMLIREHFPQLQTWDVSILATDLSIQILDKAREAVFSQLDVNRGLPAPHIVKYFERQGMNWKLKDDICKLVDFRPMNLIEPWPIMAPFDVVMLRNVLIYFDVDTKKSILKNVRRLLRPSSYFFLGGAESTRNLDDNFARVELEQSSVYRLR